MLYPYTNSRRGTSTDTLVIIMSFADLYMFQIFGTIKRTRGGDQAHFFSKINITERAMVGVECWWMCQWNGGAREIVRIFLAPRHPDDIFPVWPLTEDLSDQEK